MLIFRDNFQEQVVEQQVVPEEKKKAKKIDAVVEFQKLHNTCITLDTSTCPSLSKFQGILRFLKDI